MTPSFEWSRFEQRPALALSPYGEWLFETNPTASYGHDITVAQLPKPLEDPYMLGQSFEATLALQEHFKTASSWFPAQGYFQDRQYDVLNAVSVTHVEDEHTPDARAERAALAPLRPQSIRNPEIAPPEPALWHAPGDAPEADKTVIMAVVDDAINVVHHRFRSDKARSRVDYAWIMDGTSRQDDEPVPVGREWTRPQLEQLMRRYGRDEGEILRKLELADFRSTDTTALTRRVSHGTHMADLAAGYDYDDPGDTDPKNRRMISVQLPRRVIRESSGAFLSLFFLSSLSYIYDRAERIAMGLNRKIPLVINFSFGLGAGPHNGQHLIEQAIRDLVAKGEVSGTVGPIKVIMPAGNRYRAKGHASARAVDCGPTGLSTNWVIPAGDRSSNYLEIWVPQAASDVTVSVRLPGSDTATQFAIPTDAQAPDSTMVLRATDGSIVGWLSSDLGIEFANTPPDQGAIPKRRIFLAVGPTAYPRSRTALAPAGHWHIGVSADLRTGESIDMWVQRDERPYGYQRAGAQSYLEPDTWDRSIQISRQLNEYVDPAGQEHHVQWYGALNAISTSLAQMDVAGYRQRSEKSALYSGAASDTMPAPDLAAPSDRSRVITGILAAGSASGSRVALNGTSVAAPQVARAVADILAAGTPAERADMITAMTHPPTYPAPGTYPPNTPGAPTLDQLRGRARLFDPNRDQKRDFARSGIRMAKAPIYPM